MIHVGALANLTLQKFKAGTISIWQGGGKQRVLGGVWCGVLAEHPDVAGDKGMAPPSHPKPNVTPHLTDQTRKKYNKPSSWGRGLGEPRRVAVRALPAVGATRPPPRAVTHVCPPENLGLSNSNCASWRFRIMRDFLCN